MTPLCRRRLAPVAALLAVLSGCAGSLREPQSIVAAPEVIQSTARYEQVYVLSPGDIVEVLVDRMPELSRTATIRPDGMVTLPKAGDIRLAGLSPMDAARAVRQLLLQRVIDPQVTVGVSNPRESKVFIAGEVGKPGAVALRDAPTAAQALVLAGDVTRAAALSNVALIRLDGNGYLTAHIMHSQARGHAGLLLTLQNVPLRAGDLLIVQESKTSQFTRLIQNYVNTPLGGVAQIMSPYVQFRLLQEINRD
jgi:polysaccharide export outer membrane protein